jgi:SAM-dependent methyltransferase
MLRHSYDPTRVTSRPSDPRSSWSARRFALEQRIKRRLEKPGLISRAGHVAWNMSFWLRERLVPSRRKARHLDSGFDAAHGTDTRGYFSVEALERDPEKIPPGTPVYEATRPSVFPKAIARVPIQHEDFVFVDLGSGKGRALLLASEWPFKRVVGVEFSEALNDIAMQNIAKFDSPRKRCTDVVSLAMDARQFQLPDENLLIYLFNPFPANILEDVLEAIRSSVAEKPREVYILYAYPVLLEVFDRFDFTPLDINKEFVLFKV